MIKSNKPPIIIKKYPNRRLYNTEISSYIALNNLFEMIQQNVNFKVLDSKTGEDLTRNILIQIIFEQETKSYNLLPNNILRQIINCYQSPHSEMLPPFLETVMNAFSANSDKLDQLSMDNPLKTFEEFTKNNIEMIENNFNLFYKAFNPKNSK